MPNAYAYRKALVKGCSCNGRSNFGLAHIDPKYDPTLRPGDVVATANGFAAYTGAPNRVAEFTPVQNYSPLPKTTRDQLADTKIGPLAPIAAADITAGLPAAAAQARAEATPDQAVR